MCHCLKFVPDEKGLLNTEKTSFLFVPIFQYDYDTKASKNKFDHKLISLIMDYMAWTHGQLHRWTYINDIILKIKDYNLKIQNNYD